MGTSEAQAEAGEVVLSETKYETGKINFAIIFYLTYRSPNVFISTCSRDKTIKKKKNIEVTVFLAGHLPLPFGAYCVILSPPQFHRATALSFLFKGNSYLLRVAPSVGQRMAEAGSHSEFQTCVI